MTTTNEGTKPMPLITVKPSGPPPEKDVEDGSYVVILTELKGPKRIYPDNAGPDGTDIFEWTFAIDDEEGNREIQDNSSTASSPKSKMYGWLTALMDGKPPVMGTGFEAKDLVGRRALATIGHNEGGWPKVTNLTAIPKQLLQQKFAQATGAPTQAPKGQPARAGLNLQPSGPVPEVDNAAEADALPF